MTGNGQDRYNADNMSTTLLAPKPETIGRKIAEKRQSESLSQVALAEEAGISQVALSRIETGHAQPRPTTLRRIAAALGISARELLAGL